MKKLLSHPDLHCILASVEADAFALMMLIVIFFSIGMVALLLVLMRYKAKQRDPHVDALIEELNLDASAQKNSPEKKNSATQNATAAWEKDPDWWKSKDS